MSASRKDKRQADSLSSGRVKDVLDHLYEDAVRTDPDVRAQAHSSGIVEETDPRFYAAMQTAYMPVTPQFGRLLYMLVRLRAARHVVEFGTSFGVSTIFLAAALRDNGGGKVITTEVDAGKAARAKRNLEEAGLADYVEIRLGDALQTLRSGLPDEIPLLLLDGPKRMYLDMLQLLEPGLPQAAVIASDNSDMHGINTYLDYVRNPANGYECASILSAALGNTYGHEIVLRR